MSASPAVRPWTPETMGYRHLSDGQRVLDLGGICGFLMIEEIDFIVNLARTLPADGKYLEVGSFMGLSAVLAATGLVRRGNFGARIYCVDTWEGSFEHSEIDFIVKHGLYEVFLENIKRSGMASLITPCRGRSVEVAKTFEDESLDIIFIDGDHTYAQSLADMQAWLPKLKKDGRFLGHDAIPEENSTCGVRRAATEFAKKHGFTLRIYEPPKAHFIWEMLN